MKILFLAAGFSTRLYPLTKNFPKGLLDIKNKPIISYLLDQIISLPQEYETALITNATAFPSYQEFLNQEPYQKIKLLNNRVSDENKRLGAIGDLLLSLKELNWQDDLLVLPSDTLVSIDMAKFITFAQEKNTVTNVVFDIQNKDEIANRLGCLELDTTGEKIIDFEEKPSNPKTTLTSVPIYFYPKDKLNLIQNYAQLGLNLDSPGAIVPYLLTKTQIAAFKVTEYYYDISTVEMYQKISQHPELYL